MIAVQMFQGIGLMVLSLFALVLYVFIPAWQDRQARKNRRPSGVLSYDQVSELCIGLAVNDEIIDQLRAEQTPVSKPSA